ncbi:putative BURP domain-containing protein [Medicago truncatula]|uniref:Dehydration-responsive protein RD22 n=1 Tax=Medicago truncatula TaxID=3880 RepID=G7I4D3_MEDTR|nr:BURP domain-containing protein 3 [Medicago truncatula]AES58801.2 dehydration-responsive protein RD22 [Medicago truncatula]RHN76748.1 putative BURP domain-containing protein [Medicago truncatula]
MEFPYLSIFISLNLALVATHAALPPELYWKSKLPTTQIPKAITDILHPRKGGTWVDVGNAGRVQQLLFIYWPYDASDTQLHDYRNLALFFFEKDLHNGTKLNMQFTKTSDYGATFLPREVANSIPFSSNKVENILNYFSIKQGSAEYEIVKNTIGSCEMPAIEGEEKSCVTSLESMVDFTTSKLGNNVEAVSTEVNKESDIQQYIIAKGVKKLGENKIVVCHPMDYPYTVFYCHKLRATKVYYLPMEGVDGTKVKAVAICHSDTSQWSPKHLAFQVLKIQPGTVPVCHFLPQGHVVWFSK